MISNRNFFSSCSIYFVMLTSLQAASSEVGIRAITNPSADITLSFVQPGRITKVYFKEGDFVDANQILIQQDDSVEQIQLAQLEAESRNTTRIEASKAALAQKQVDLKKLERAAARNAATELEVEHARLEFKMAELSLELSKFEHEQAIRKYEEARKGIERMSLKSPIDGTIEEIHVETGESINALDDVARIVQIDPLWIDVPVNLTKASTLKNAGVARVTFPNPDDTIVEGKIIYVAAVADAASGNLRIRVEVPNKSRRPAGEHVYVHFPTSQ
jgi:membrane fusion protein (multidrug efflux system)